MCLIDDEDEYFQESSSAMEDREDGAASEE